VYQKENKKQKSKISCNSSSEKYYSYESYSSTGIPNVNRRLLLLELFWTHIILVLGAWFGSWRTCFSYNTS
jgi:hypothetical protein